MAKLISDKIGIKEKMRAVFINAPTDILKDIHSPGLDLKTKLSGHFDYIHLFALSQGEFHKKFPKLMAHLKQTGMLWVSWPKSGQKGTDLNLPTIIKLGYDYGLVESKTLSINEIWSALKFTHPKKGKAYNNSYGKLKT